MDKCDATSELDGEKPWYILNNSDMRFLWAFDKKETVIRLKTLFDPSLL